MSNTYPPLSSSEKLKLFGRSFVFAQAHPVQLFSAFLFFVLTTILAMHFDNIGYEFPLSEPAPVFLWAIGYLFFNSLLYSWMIINEVRYYQSKLHEISKIGLYSPNMVLDQLLKANYVYIPTVIFWPLMIVLTLTFTAGGPGGYELNLVLWVPVLYLGIGILSFSLSLLKKQKIKARLGLTDT